MALFHRDAKGGSGQEIDLSLLAPVVAAIGIQPGIYEKTGELPPRLGNRVFGTAPRNVYQTGDGKWVAVSAAPQSVADRVLALVGHEEVIHEPWFRNNAGRYEHTEELDKYVADWIAERSQEEAIDAFIEAGAAIGPIYSAKDILADPQVLATEMLVSIPDPDIGDMVQNAPTFKMSETPGSIRFLSTPFASATDEILGNELGKSEKELDDLRAAGVIGMKRCPPSPPTRRDRPHLSERVGYGLPAVQPNGNVVMTNDSEQMDEERQLAEAVAMANIPVLLMVLTQLTGELRWLGGAVPPSEATRYRRQR